MPSFGFAGLDSVTTTVTDDLPHDNLQVQAISIVFVFPAVASGAVLPFCRGCTSVPFHMLIETNDWVICGREFCTGARPSLCAMVTFLTHSSCDCQAKPAVIKYNCVGYHLWDVPPDWDSTPSAKFPYATELLYNPILALIKTSILLFPSPADRAEKRPVATFLITTFNYLPPDKKCINFADFVTGTASVSIFTGFLVLLMSTTVLAGIFRVILLDNFDRHIPADSTSSVLFCLSTIEVGLALLPPVHQP
ncbi:hypothetical protein BDW75DRAFT_227878 [Aspergillus navahoensis]